MGNQLFYTYTSDNGKFDESLGVFMSSYAYSVSFDTKRKSIWTQGKEYGIPSIAARNYADTHESETLALLSDPTSSYQQFVNNSDTVITMYTNQYGQLVVDNYQPIHITNFMLLDENKQEILTEDKIYAVGSRLTRENFAYFTFEVNGSGVIRDPSSCSWEFQGNSDLNVSHGDYPMYTNIVRGTMNSANENVTIDPYNTVLYDNGNPEHIGNQANEELVMRLTVSDNRGYSDSKLLPVAKFWYTMYIIVANSVTQQLIENAALHTKEDAEESGWTEDWSQLVGNIGSDSDKATIQRGTGYLWLVIPSVAIAGKTVKMYQGGGEAEWHTPNGTQEIIDTVQYTLFRTPKKNISGAKYFVEIN